MNCRDFEQLIALHVEGDVSAVESGRVETHVQECSECCDLAEDLKKSQAVFKSMRQDVPDATALSVLRERVLSEVGGIESISWFERILFGGLRRKAALPGIALLIVGAGALWLARSQRVIPMAPTEVAVNRPPSVLVTPSNSESQPGPVSPRLTQKRLPRPAPAPAPGVEESKQVAIKFITDDPNVIIYWLVDEKGD